MPKFANVPLTAESIQAARESFAANAQGCIDEIKDGRVKMPSHVNLEQHFADCRARGAEYLAGKWDHTLAFLQRAHTIQTGECIALLP